MLKLIAKINLKLTGLGFCLMGGLLLSNNSKFMEILKTNSAKLESAKMLEIVNTLINYSTIIGIIFIIAGLAYLLVKEHTKNLWFWIILVTCLIATIGAIYTNMLISLVDVGFILFGLYLLMKR